MPDGGQLTVATANGDLDGIGEVRPGHYVAISVNDTGIGMPPEVVARVFEPFFTTKPIGQGTGLGLSMLYGFAKQSGGSTMITSEMGRGTTVTLHLPRHDGPLAATDEAADQQKVPAIAPSGGTVLVVEDEALIRELIVEALHDFGCRVLEEADGAGGLRVLESGRRIDLLITDVGLPGGLNGRQLADAARVWLPELPVLFITGYAHTSTLGTGAALEPGMELLAKPFTLDALRSKVGAIVGRR